MLSPPDREQLAANLSFVLHERSDSRAVCAVVERCRQHFARTMGSLEALARIPLTPTTAAGAPEAGIQAWLTANVGEPSRLQGLSGSGLDPRLPIICVDSDTVSVPNASTSANPGLSEACTLRVVDFFRAPARLRLPSGWVGRVGVAAVVFRPDLLSLHAIYRGAFDWPAERTAALREVERLIQAHADQWWPSRQLWEAPAELLLEGEIE